MTVNSSNKRVTQNNEVIAQRWDDISVCGNTLDMSFPQVTSELVSVSLASVNLKNVPSGAHLEAHLTWTCSCSSSG